MLDNDFIGYDDQELAVSIKEGNLQFLGYLYDKYAPALYGIICRITNNKQLNEEILSIVFVKAWNEIAVLHPSGTSLFTWLINIARQTAFDIVKLRGEKNPGNNNSVYEGNKNSFEEVSPFKQQDPQSAFDLVYFKRLNFTQAAASLGISVTELKNNIRMTLQNLQNKKVKA